mgnify:CR=1 FL=1
MFLILKEIRFRSLLGGVLSYIPGVFSLWDRLRPMGNPRPPEYGRNIFLARLANAHAAGLDVKLDTVMELGPGRSLSAPIAALIHGSQVAIGMDAVAYANSTENLNVFESQVKDASLCSERETELRHAIKVAGNVEQETVLRYRAPWSDESTIPKDSVDFIFSISVLEHVTDPLGVYQTCFSWLRPGGVMSHKIDHSSHGITKHWNGHYWLPDWLWKLILGRRPYAINCWTPDQHHEAALKAGLEIVSMKCSEPMDHDSIFYDQLSNPRYANIPRQSLFSTTSVLIMRKPDAPVSSK